MNPRKIIALVLVVISLTACMNLPDSATSFGPTRVLDLVVKRDPQAPVDRTGAVPHATIKVYDLTNSYSFEAATLANLYESGSATLGRDILSQYEVKFSPPTSGIYLTGRSINLTEDTKFIGVIAAFDDTDHTLSRAITAVARDDVVRLDVFVSSQSIRLGKGLVPIAPPSSQPLLTTSY